MKIKKVYARINPMKKALITGITGQDGSYLAEFLIDKGYEIHGVVRRSSSTNVERISHLLEQLYLHEGDLSDASSLKRIFQKTTFDEVYNLAAMSHVQASFEMPEYTADVDALGVLRLLDIIKTHSPKTRFYQASTSELFGKAREIPQRETTPFHPRSPYGVAKLYAYWIVVNYREAYGMYACNGILFNHESPRRGETFVSRKITQAVVKIAAGQQEKILLGNLDSQRDWGHAKDFVEGMWLMLQQDQPDDFVLATGETTTVRKFVEMAFEELGMTITWTGSSFFEKGIDQNGKVRIEVSPQFFRPAEVDLLIGDATKAKTQLGWKPRTTVQELIKLMIHSDREVLRK